LRHHFVPVAADGSAPVVASAFGVAMSIVLSERPAGIQPAGVHQLSFIHNETTPLYVVCSPRPSVGKTLLSRLLVEFHDVDDRPVTAFDLAEEGSQLADFLPDCTISIDINDRRGQTEFFNTLISDRNTIQVIDLGHRNFRNFFTVIQKIGFFDEARRHAIEPLLLFMMDSDPTSAQAYSILQRWFADVLILPVRNQAVTEGMIDGDTFANTSAVPVSPEIPALQPLLQTLVKHQSFSFAQFWCRALERFPARLENDLRRWMERIFSQFRQIETLLAYGELAKRWAEDRVEREIASAHDHIAILEDELAQAKDKGEQLGAETAAQAEQIALLQGELMQAKQIARDSSLEADARIEQIRKQADERIARKDADTEGRLSRAHAEIEGTFARLEAEAMQARQRAANAEAEATTQIDLITREADERLKHVFRLETELTNANQRAERAEYWLSRIRNQIEGNVIPSFAAIRDGSLEHSPSLQGGLD
jgi:hypothetical protein